MYKRIKRYFLQIVTLSLLFLLGFINAFGQDDKLNKEVQVVRPYEPAISDAFKLNLLPKIEDTLKLSPNLSYNIIQRPIIANYNLIPIAPARMLPLEMNTLQNTYIKLGLGNHTSPLIEAYFNNGRNKEFMYGGWIQNHSSFGRITLNNSKKVDANYGETDINIFGKKILKNSILSGSAGFNNHKVSYYGYDIYRPAASINLNSNPKEQILNQFNTGIEYKSSYNDSTHLNYSFETGFNHLGDKFDMQENLIRVSLKMDKFLKEDHFGGEFSIHHYMKNSSLDSVNNTIVSLSPWINLYGKQWRALAGVSLIFDANGNYEQSYFYPKGFLSYDIISHYFIPFIEIDGYLEENSYAKITAENPWVLPGLNTSNTSHKLIIRGGIKGNLSTKVSYNFHASYSLIDSMHFFVNANLTSTNPLNNRFSVETDNVALKQFVGELTIAPAPKLNFFFRAEYADYSMHNIQKPWHKPDYQGLASVRYNIKDKILIKLDLFASGKRYVKTAVAADPIVSLNGIVDVNLGLEYRYNSKLSAFVNLNNLTSKKYDLWYLYPMYRFNVMAGLTYSF